MAYDEIEIYQLDINWYFLDCFNRVCVAASAGGQLPKAIMSNDEGNEQFHNVVMEMPVTFQVERNPNTQEFIQGINNENLNLYFRNFEDLAGRGLYVFDKIKLDEPEDGFYLLVAYPIYDTHIDPFPFNRDNLSIIPKIDKAIISRKNQQLLNWSFDQLDIIKLIDSHVK